jgi:hypothetical protein
MRSLSVIVVAVAVGLFAAACGGTSKKGAQAPQTPSAAPNASSQGMKDTGRGMVKTGGNVLQEGSANALVRSGGLAQAMTSLKGALVQKGVLSRQPQTAFSAVSDYTGTLAATAGELKQGMTPAQTLAKLGNTVRMQLAGSSKLATGVSLQATGAGAVALTAAGQLRAGVPQASAFRTMAAFAAQSAQLKTKVAASPQSATNAFGKAVAGSASGRLRAQNMTAAKALGSLGGLATKSSANNVASQKQAAGVQSVDGNAGTAQAGAAGAQFKAAPSAAQSLAGLATKASTANKQAAFPQTAVSGGGVATGDANRSGKTAPNARHDIALNKGKH